MRIGGENRQEWIADRHWDRLVEYAGINPRFIHKTVREMARGLSSVVDTVAGEFNENYGRSAIVEEITRIVKRAALKAEG